MKRITLLPLSLRPREKILKSGPDALTIEEIISVLLVTGTKALPVSTIATKIAKLIKKDATLTKESLRDLGLGPTKIAQILAACEIGKRLKNGSSVISFTSPQQVFAHAYEIVAQEKESLLCFYLNARGELIKKETLAVGSLNRANLLPREIFSIIKELPVASIILVHNHPSGNLDPSDQDILFTKRVRSAAEILGITLLDHLVVTKNGWKKIPV